MKRIKLALHKNYGKEPLKQFYHTDRIPDKLLKLNKLDRDEAFAIAMKDKWWTISIVRIAL